MANVTSNFEVVIKTIAKGTYVNPTHNNKNLTEKASYIQSNNFFIRYRLLG